MNPMNLCKAALLLAAALPALAFAQLAVPPASAPDGRGVNVVQVFRDSQVVMTPPAPKPGAKPRTVRAQVSLSPALEREYTAEEAYYRALWAYEVWRLYPYPLLWGGRPYW